MQQTGRVLIAGAGPVGCVAALSLARRGIPVTLFEAEAALPIQSRASTFHPPTLDMLDELGVAAKLITQGLVCPVWQYRDRTHGVVAEWDLGLLASHTDHPYRLQCEQDHLTALIAHALAAMPEVEFRFNARLTGVRQDANSVTVRLATPEGSEEVSGAYLIGADGGSSHVRTAAGIAFDGLTFPELWLVASTPFDFSTHFTDLAPISYFADPEEWFVFVRIPGLWRVMVPARAGETAADMVDEDNLQARMQRVCATGEAYEITHRTAWQVHQRVASRYRAGRVLLAGDAAHINNPLGGMGMNGGIHDAVNLVDKLVRVWRGEDDGDALDRYDRQRRSIALEDVQKATIRNKELLEERDEAVRRERQEALRETAADSVKAEAFLLRSSMISALRRADEIA